jgi:hypothetical protein
MPRTRQSIHEGSLVRVVEGQRSTTGVAFFGEFAHYRRNEPTPTCVPKGANVT